MKKHVAEIVAAYVGKHRLDASELPPLIDAVSQALGGLGQEPTTTPAAPRVPAVAIRRSVGADAITCLDCGKKAKMLKRHLTTKHGLTADEYRARWGLAADYPVVAQNYSARRSELAKSTGLGRRG
jgi:predicted transcriptional regulator